MFNKFDEMYKSIEVAEAQTREDFETEIEELKTQKIRIEDECSNLTDRIANFDTMIQQLEESKIEALRMLKKNDLLLSILTDAINEYSYETQEDDDDDIFADCDEYTEDTNEN